MKTLVIATRNTGKLNEFNQLLATFQLNVISLLECPDIPEIAETGASFTENAILKAEAVTGYTGEFAMADDSGLEVDALGGRPGIFSARFAGLSADDAANNEKLLEELREIPLPDRTARFRSVIAISGPGYKTRVAEGVCEGLVITEPRGKGGFGYDPLFFVPSAGKTFAEMAESEKNAISHRARAMSAACHILKEIFQ